MTYFRDGEDGELPRRMGRARTRVLARCITTALLTCWSVIITARRYLINDIVSFKNSHSRRPSCFPPFCFVFSLPVGGKRRRRNHRPRATANRTCRRSVCSEPQVAPSEPLEYPRHRDAHRPADVSVQGYPAGLSLSEARRHRRRHYIDFVAPC